MLSLTWTTWDNWNRKMEQAEKVKDPIQRTRWIKALVAIAYGDDM